MSSKARADPSTDFSTDFSMQPDLLTPRSKTFVALGETYGLRVEHNVKMQQEMNQAWANQLWAFLDIGGLFLITRRAEHKFLSSFIFAATILCRSAYTVLSRPLDTCEDLMETIHPEAYYSLCLTMAYMCIDLVVSATDSAADKSMDRSMKLHHIMAILVVGSVQYFGTGHGVGAYVGINELSTLFLSTMYEAPVQWQPTCKVLFAVTFFLCRILLLPFVIWKVLPCSDYPSWVSIFTFLILHFGLNCFWMRSIAAKCQRQLQY